MAFGFSLGSVGCKTGVCGGVAVSRRASETYGLLSLLSSSFLAAKSLVEYVNCIDVEDVV